jgi:hypothetical protein
VSPLDTLSVADEILRFHEQLNAGIVDESACPVSPHMSLQLPELFPWHPVHLRGLAALRGFYDARQVLADGTLEVTTVGSTGEADLVAICSRESATRGGASLSWTSLWVYRISEGTVIDAQLIYGLSDELMATFWTEVGLLEDQP